MQQNIIYFIFLLFIQLIICSPTEVENKSTNLRKTSDNKTNEHFLYIETKVSKEQLLKLFSSQNFHIVHSVDKSEEENNDKKPEIKVPEMKEDLIQENKEPEMNNDKHPLVTADQEDFLDQISDTEKEKTFRENKNKTTEFDAEESNYYNLIDYNQKLIAKTILEHTPEVEVKDDRFSYLYSLLTFFAVVILSVVGLKFILNCDKNEEAQPVNQNKQISQQELLLNYK